MEHADGQTDDARALTSQECASALGRLLAFSRVLPARYISCHEATKNTKKTLTLFFVRTLQRQLKSTLPRQFKSTLERQFESTLGRQFYPMRPSSTSSSGRAAGDGVASGGRSCQRD